MFIPNFKPITSNSKFRIHTVGVSIKYPKQTFNTIITRSGDWIRVRYGTGSRSYHGGDLNGIYQRIFASKKFELETVT